MPSPFVAPFVVLLHVQCHCSPRTFVLAFSLLCRLLSRSSSANCNPYCFLRRWTLHVAREVRVRTSPLKAALDAVCDAQICPSDDM